jgi:hypothetical protein
MIRRALLQGALMASLLVLTASIEQGGFRTSMQAASASSCRPANGSMLPAAKREPRQTSAEKPLPRALKSRKHVR